MAESKWTTKLVADRMEEAANILRRLPSVRPKGYLSSWPQVIHDAMEAYGWNDAVLRLGPPSAEQITRMDTALTWLRWLEPEMVRLVWLRAERTPWKLVMGKLGVSRATAWRQWSAALTVIVARLNVTDRKDVETPC